jgi:hypothetical protein
MIAINFTKKEISEILHNDFSKELIELDIKNAGQKSPWPAIKLINLKTKRQWQRK